MIQREPMTPPSVTRSVSEEPKANQVQTISKRLQVAKILVNEGFGAAGKGEPPEDPERVMDDALDYLDDCAETFAAGITPEQPQSFEDVLTAIINDHQPRRAA